MGVRAMHIAGLVIYPNKDTLLSSTGNIHLHSDTFIVAKSHIVRNETHKIRCNALKGSSTPKSNLL